jgi:hypothetical protein
MLVIGLSVEPAFAAPLFSVGTSIPGAIAYQDSLDKSQFWYLPTTEDQLLGGRLRTFRAVSFGVGAPYYVQDDKGNYRSVAGGILSGTFAFDLSDKQRAALIAAIQTTFGISNPKLLPIPLRSPQINSVLLTGIYGEFGKVEQQLPTGFQIGPDVAFSAGSVNSLFAQIIADQQVGAGIVANPAFALNVTANAEFVGDPWTYNVSCDLSQVWKQVRESAGATVSYGWVTIGSAQYQKLWQDLQKKNVCTFSQVEGSLDTAKYGRQIGEMMKTIFQAVNDQAVNGTGFFKFEPNPEAPPVTSSSGGFGLFGWSISANASYSEAFFNQSIQFKQTVTYTGRLEAPVAFSAVMAVSCGDQTRQYFADLGDTTEPCITQAKIDTFQARAKREAALKTQKILELTQELADGKITDVQFEKIKAVYDVTDFTDTLVPNTASTSLLRSLGVIENGKSPPLIFESQLTDSQIQSVEEHALSLPTVRNAPSVGIRVLGRNKI